MNASTRPHLLYVAWGYPPSKSAGVYRTLATANSYAEAGWRVTVITADRETFDRISGSDPSLEAQIHPDITIVRVPFEPGTLDTDLRRWSRTRALFPELWNEWRKSRDRRSFPEPVYGSWRSAIEEAALEIHAQNPVDLTLGTGNPHVDFMPGWLLHEKYGVPYVMDYRDAWQLGVFTGRRLFTGTSPAGRWEQKLVEKAHEIWFVNSAILDWHAKLYPDAASRMHNVANGFDENLDVPVRADRDRGVTFGYVGTVTKEVPVAEFLAGWRLARQQSALVAASEVHIYGYLGHGGADDSAKDRLLDDSRADGVFYLGPVAKSRAFETYSSFDSTLLLLGTGTYVTSGKVYQYLSTGLPIVAIHDPGNASTAVLDEFPALTAVANLRPEEIARALVEAAELAASQTAEDRVAAQTWAQKHARAGQLGPRISALARHVESTDRTSR